MRILRGWISVAAVVCLAHGGLADLSITNSDAVLTFNSVGYATSLKERATGRELLSAPGAMVSALLPDSSHVAVEGMTPRPDGSLSFKLARGMGEVALQVDAFEGGWSFTVREIKTEPIKYLYLCNLNVACRRWRGNFAGLLSDPQSGVALRAYDLGLTVGGGGNRFYALAEDSAAAAGQRFGLAGAPRERLGRVLQAMTIESGAPISFTGGAWSRQADECRGSYLQPVMEYAATEDWIDLARRGGFSTIHFRRWMETLGHYATKTNLFPRGWTDLFDAAEKIHAAGLRVGIHTLTGCIGANDPWVASELNTNLLAWCSYTLAADLPPEATELVVNEPPAANHDTVFTYSGNGNAIRIGTEIVQYDSIRCEKPFAFTGLTRGAFGTARASHKAGARAAYLQQRYLAFYPHPDSPLADALVDRIAAFFHGGRFDQIYLDGAEGMGMVERGHQHQLVRRILERLPASPIVEASSWSVHNWWTHSRVGAWDSPQFAAKRFIDDHVRAVSWNREAEFLEVQMGWWSIRNPCPHFRGLLADENEYFSSRVAGMDASMSLTGLDVNKKPLNWYRGYMLTVMGWYERFRLARAWADGVRERLNQESAEFRLRQNAEGLWTLTPVTTVVQRVKGNLPGSERWIMDFSGVTQPPLAAEARVEAFYAPGDYNGKNVLKLFDPASEEGLTLASASNVLASISRSTDPERGAVLLLSAANKGAPSNGAWVRLERTFEPHAQPGGRRAMGFWLRGDGSGAILNFQLSAPREWGEAHSDHFVKLDFTGWRYVDFVMREREVEEAFNWRWDAPLNTRSRYMKVINMNHLSSMAFWLNGIPEGRETSIALGEARMFTDKSVTLDQPALGVNGRKHRIPFALASGDFAELEDGVWRHFTERGDLVAEAPGAALALGTGVNQLEFTAAEGAASRAEVTLFARGAPFPALRTDLSAAQRQQLAYEPALDIFYAPAKGAVGKGSLKMRPGERATVEIEIVGPVERPTVVLGEHRIAFPVNLAEGDRLFCRNGRDWRVIDSSRAERAQGSLTNAAPALSGVVEAGVVSENPVRAAATLKLVKIYRCGDG